VRELGHALGVRRRKEKTTFVTRPQRRWFVKHDPHTSAVLVGYTTENGEVGTTIITASAARRFNYICDRIKKNERVNAPVRQRQFERLCSEVYWMLRVTGKLNLEQLDWTSIRSFVDATESTAYLDDEARVEPPLTTAP
jgi:hypothetical protein